MNHDAIHCMDYTEKCPKDCYRAMLTKELYDRWTERFWGFISWCHFEGTDECKKGDSE